MAKYRIKQVEIEAVRFTDKTKDSVFLWATQIQGNVTHGWDRDGNPILNIPTLEGVLECSLGDYLIVEPSPTDWHKLYPCKPTVFEKTYESVE